MSTNTRTHLIEVPIGGNGGEVWNRLHSEREDICEAMLKDCQLKPELEAEVNAPRDPATANWHRELLQARLRKVDDALDRLMSGSYGNCSKCGKWIEDTKLAFDPAIEFCLSCWDGERNKMIGLSQPPDVVLNSIHQFDTIMVRTINSDYRILLLDPNTGRALVEGGQFVTEPREGVVTGSKINGSHFKPGSIAVGCHLEMWVDQKIISTSAVQSITVEHRDGAESIEAIKAAVH
ncbi:MAG TPA: TraR/DksA C4-type zinc finger protein [Pyrinomonadaceae bacterium]